MDKQIRYTDDGKKVVVVGKLNNQETIVQEIFVSDSGNEIPSGENFVVKSLHEQPVKSWKEKNLENIEKEYNKKDTEYRNELKRLEDSYRTQRDLLRAKLEYAGKVLKTVSPKSFDTFVNYLTGKITHILYIRYGGVEIIEMKDTKEVFTDWNDKPLKLVTIYGKDNGDLQYRINYYHDGSGRDEEIYPFTSYEEAFEKAEKTINGLDRYYEDTIKSANKLGIKLDETKLKAFYDGQRADLEKTITNYEERVIGYRNKLNSIPKL